MSARMATRSARRRKSMMTYLWIFALAALTISLIYWEQTAILYILATLGVTVLLVVVAMSDLAKGEKFSPEPLVSDSPTSLGEELTGLGQTPGNKSNTRAAKR